MVAKITTIVMLLIGGAILTGCAPLIGAGAVVIADEAAEREGGNLF